MTVTRRELRLRAQEEAARLAAEAQRDTSENRPVVDAPLTESAPAEPVEPILTRRELRRRRILQETGEIPVVPAEDSAPTDTSDAPEPPVDAPEPPATPDPVDESDVETDFAPPPPAVSPDEVDDVRPTRRRRPVLPPQTTGSMPVIDPETGTIGAVTITFPQIEPEPEPEPEPAEPARSEPAQPEPAEAEVPAASLEVGSDVPAEEGESSVPVLAAPAVVNLPPLPPVVDDAIDFDSILSGTPSVPKEVPEPQAPDAEPAPTVSESSAVDDTGTPKRTSLFSILNDPEGVNVAQAEAESHSNLTVEQLAVHEQSSAGVTFLRYLVLVLAMFIIGGVIWLIATRVDAVIVSEGLTLVETYGSGG